MNLFLIEWIQIYQEVLYMCGSNFQDEETDEIKAIIKAVERKHKESVTGEVYPSK